MSVGLVSLLAQAVVACRLHVAKLVSMAIVCAWMWCAVVVRMLNVQVSPEIERAPNCMCWNCAGCGAFYSALMIGCTYLVHPLAYSSVHLLTHVLAILC